MKRNKNGSSKNTARRKSITYPDGRVIDIGHGVASSADDLMSRIASFKINGESTNLADYTYFGLTSIAKVSYLEPAVNLSYIKTASAPVSDAGDQYTGYDRFGRTVDMRWVMSSGGAVRDRFQYGYDRSSQRTWKSNLAASAGDGQDEHCSYDGLYQVTEAARGELNINRSAIGGIPAKEEGFSYDPTGNWDQYVEKSDGTTDLDQTRKSNKDNQVTQFDGSSENVEHDKAGNATKMVPDKGGDWSKYYQLKWDAWNRLVEVKDSASAVVATYAYDGTTRRITKTVSGVVRHYYYNDQWKAVEERKDAATTADRQYAWGTQYRNDLILRDRDTNGNGTLDERLFATHDALGNCTAILNTSGAVQERYGYSAFGVRRIMQADFSSRAVSSFAWDFGFQGEFLDDETGYINYGFRYYMPETGRWPSRDPIGEDGGLNLYGFVYNDPVNWIDLLGGLPLGHSPGNWDEDWGSGESSKGNCQRYATDDPAQDGEDHNKDFPGFDGKAGDNGCVKAMKDAFDNGAMAPNPDAEEERDKCDKGYNYVAVSFSPKAGAGTKDDIHSDKYQCNPDNIGGPGWRRKRGKNAATDREGFKNNGKGYGDKLTDPSKQTAPGYEHCGYVCLKKG